MATDAERLKAALAEVSEWRWCEAGRLPYRREPFLHERAWLHQGSWLQKPPAERLDDPYAIRRVGVDGDGRVVVVGPEGISLGEWTPEAVLTIRWDGADSEVRIAGEFTVRYRTDESGQVVSSSGDDYEERYRYDAAGRVVAIDEGPALLRHFRSPALSMRDAAGGQLVIDYDEAGALSIIGPDGRDVWRRLPGHFADRWTGYVKAGASAVRGPVDEAVARLGAEDAEAFVLCMVYVEGAGSYVEPVCLGLQRDRTYSHQDAFPIGLSDGLGDIADIDVGAEWPSDLDKLQDVALHTAGDPVRTLLTGICRELARQPPASVPHRGLRRPLHRARRRHGQHRRCGPRGQPA